MAEGKISSDRGVRKYFFYVKEEVSSDWKDLAFHLDFRRSDIDNIVSRNRDDKSRCMDLLEEWFKKNGEKATIEVLMEALSEASLQSTVDGLKNKYHELKTPQASPSQQETAELFQKAVKNYYELKLTYVKPLIWNDNFTLNLRDIFTQLELMPMQGKQHQLSKRCAWSRRGTKLKSLDDLFNPNGVTSQSKAPRCILIEGKAGGGKTTFLSKEAIDAVSKTSELGRRYDIVLLIRLREVREGETIDEMVWDQCVPETTEGVDVQSIRTILQRNESRVLFLLDGYDELRPEAKAAGQAIPKLLDGKLYPNSTIVITSRPSGGVQQYTRPNCHLHIKGFSPEQVVEYIRQYFSIAENSERGEQLIKQNFRIEKSIFYPCTEDGIFPRPESHIVKDLIHTPIFLLLVCVLWEEDQEMISTGTMTGLYNNLLTCLVRKLCKREGVDMPMNGLPVEMADALLQLGKFALEALHKNEILLDLTQVERENVNWELLLKLGVVSLEVSASKWHPRKQLHFSHKTMQEFLAGRYIAHALENQDIAEMLQLTSISKAHELSNLLRFTCGSDSRAAQAVFKELSNLRSKAFPDTQAGRFKKHSMRSTKTSVSETYQAFVLLCLEFLEERKDPDVLRAISKALPVIAIDLVKHNGKRDILMYYLENILSFPQQDRVIHTVRINNAHQYLEQISAFTFIPSLDLRLRITSFESLDGTARLVSILKNAPGLTLRTLDLQHTHLTPSTLQHLVQGFKHISLLEELDLSHNDDLGDTGMEVLQVGLSSVPHLSILRLRGVHMTAMGLSSLAPSLHHLVRLRELDICTCINNIDDTGLESLSTVLRTLTALQVLELACNFISATGMRTLAPVLYHLTGLITLDIRKNFAIGDPGLECLADILPRLKAIKYLNLCGTFITDRGISALIKALPHLVDLQVLDVGWNCLRDSGVVSLVQTLGQPSSLDMEQNPAAEKSLATHPHKNTTLQELYIGENSRVSGSAMRRVAELLSALPALTMLTMPSAQLSDTDAMALAAALPKLPALKELHMWRNYMDPVGFQAVVQAAEEHPTLEMLGYDEELVPEGADIRARCLVIDPMCIEYENDDEDEWFIS